MKRGFLGLAGGFAPVKESAGMRGEYLPTSLEVCRATGGERGVLKVRGRALLQAQALAA